MLPTPPFSQHPSGEGGNAKLPTAQREPRNATERHGTLRNLAERLNLAIPHWGPPYFGGFSPNVLIFYAPNAPFPQHPIGEGWNAKLPTKQRNPRNATERHGALRNLAERLNLAIPHWGPPYFGGFSPNYVIFLRRTTPFFPTPKWERGKCDTTAQTKGRRGTPRNVTERYGT